MSASNTAVVHVYASRSETTLMTYFKEVLQSQQMIFVGFRNYFKELLGAKRVTVISGLQNDPRKWTDWDVFSGKMEEVGLKAEIVRRDGGCEVQISEI